MNDAPPTSLNGRQQPPTPPQSPHSKSPASARKRGAWWRGDLLFLTGVLILAALTYSVLAGASALGQRRASTSPSNTSASAGAKTSAGSNGVLVKTQLASEQVYKLPNGQAGIMWPVVDAHGDVWFGEMTTNHLARLDPHTGTVTEWTPPNGNFGIMQVLADGNGNIWFAEDGSNYIGEFNPASQQFKTYPLGSVPDGTRVGPYAMQFDSSGKIWFTGVNGGVIGRFDPATGQFQTWQIPKPDGNALASPDCIAVVGGKVWFGTLSGGQVGYFDMATEKFTMYHVSESGAVVFGMTADPSGHIWFTELQAAYLGEVDPTNGKITTQRVPKIGDTSDGLYQIVATRDGSLWFPSAGADSLVHYTPSTGAYVFWQLSQSQSIPYGLVLDHAGNLWFTADGTPNYVAQVKP